MHAYIVVTIVFRIAFREETFYINEAVNVSIERCCTGYIGSPPSCQRMCTVHVYNYIET